MTYEDAHPVVVVGEATRDPPGTFCLIPTKITNHGQQESRALVRRQILALNMYIPMKQDPAMKLR